MISFFKWFLRTAETFVFNDYFHLFRLLSRRGLSREGDLGLTGIIESLPMLIYHTEGKRDVLEDILKDNLTADQIAQVNWQKSQVL